ncbi:hypothetical protein B0H10DRAFT_1977045 [Mycena sp. CBHHK59/15]|nr:hypothetical protein B0H10DRAFT_1977045 [Mycena sp. CBHHK59/15]
MGPFSEMKLFTVKLSPWDISTVSDAILQQIIINCNPLELLNIQILSKRFYQILQANPSSWATARCNMDPPVPPPPEVAATGIWSESAYAQFIFGGGHCTVKSCNQWTDRFPCSFAVKLRACSDKCLAVLYRRLNNPTTQIKNSYLNSTAIPGKRGLRKMGQTQRLHFHDWLPYNEQEITVFPVYTVSSIATADQEWFSARAVTEKRSARPPVKILRTLPELQQQYKLRAEALPRIMENAMALQEWSQQYSEAEARTRLNNIVIFRDVIGPKEQVPYRALLRTPTLSRALDAFARSLTPLDMRSWCGMRFDVLKEQASLK